MLNIIQIIDMPTAKPFIPSLKFKQFIKSKMHKLVKKNEYSLTFKTLSNVEKYKVSILIEFSRLSAINDIIDKKNNFLYALSE